VEYVDQRGIWHVAGERTGDELLTACGRTISGDPETLRRREPPAPLCSRCPTRDELSTSARIGSS
jgi:hypothetical protein